MSKDKYNPLIHFINYDSLYTENLMKEAFLIFLEKEKNIAPFNFQLKLLKTKLEDNDEFKIMYKELIESYILCKNENQINLPSNLRNRSIKNYDEMNEENIDFEECKKVLLEVKSLLYQDLYLDSVKK